MFDLRVIALVRSFLSATVAPVRRKNLDAASFVAFQSVRATMLATLENPAGLNDQTLIEARAEVRIPFLPLIDDPLACLACLDS